MWTALLTQPPGGQAVFLFEADGLSGFVSAGPSREPEAPSEEGEVYALFVDSRRWASGVGNVLLAQSVDHLDSLGVRTAKLWVLDRNQRTRRFYEARRWVDSGLAREDDRGRFLRYVLDISKDR